jgi:feruloyl esterase
MHYFGSVTEELGAKTSAEFLRLYMVPGMGHCGGGAGGASWPNGWVPPDADSFHSIDAALEAWVEQGTAPAEIVATKYKDNRPGAPVQRSRPVCPWPETAKYKGTGGVDDAGSFNCAK